MNTFRNLLGILRIPSLAFSHNSDRTRPELSDGFGEVRWDSWILDLKLCGNRVTSAVLKNDLNSWASISRYLGGVRTSRILDCSASDSIYHYLSRL